jgi:hypothetical protein
VRTFSRGHLVGCLRNIIRMLRERCVPSARDHRNLARAFKGQGEAEREAGSRRTRTREINDSLARIDRVGCHLNVSALDSESGERRMNPVVLL